MQGGEGRAQHSTVARENIEKVERGVGLPLAVWVLSLLGIGPSINTSMHQRHMRI